MVEENSNIFFQYRKIDTHTLEALENHKLYFSNPSEFNDPFDSKLDLIWRGNITDWNRFLWNYNVKDPVAVMNLLKDNIKKGVIKKRGSDYLLSPHNKKLKAINKNLQLQNEDYPRVCCFSKVNNNILMWSHYANGHKGICLCFKTEKKGNGNFLILDSKPEFLYPVTYKEKDKEELPKQVNMLSKYDPKELTDFLTTKHYLWTYEEEYRLILWKDSFNDKFNKSFKEELERIVNGEKIPIEKITEIHEKMYSFNNSKFIKSFRKNDLEGIIFGIKTSFEDVNKVYEKIKANYLDEGIKVKFYKAQEMQDKYSIKLKKIDNLGRSLKNGKI